MGEVLFYHLTQTPLEATLPDLLERSLQRGWRVQIRGNNADGIDRLDRHLWTYNVEAFLPHGCAGGPHDAAQPILLTTEDDNSNNADVLMLVDGVTMAPEIIRSYQRVCVFFDGNNPDAVDAARVYWTSLKTEGFKMKYWAQEGGRWTAKA